MICSPPACRESEDKAHGELQLTSRREAGLRVARSPSASAAHVRIEAAVGELRVVEQVEYVGAGFRGKSPREFQVLHHAHIPVVVSRTIDGVSSKVTGACVVATAHRRSREVPSKDADRKSTRLNSSHL